MADHNGYNHVNTTPRVSPVWHEGDPEGWGAEFFGRPNTPGGTRVATPARETASRVLASNPHAAMAGAQGERDTPNVTFSPASAKSFLEQFMLRLPKPHVPIGHAPPQNRKGQH